MKSQAPRTKLQTNLKGGKFKTRLGPFEYFRLLNFPGLFVTCDLGFGISTPEGV